MSHIRMSHAPGAWIDIDGPINAEEQHMEGGAVSARWPLFSEPYGKGGLGVNYENGIALKLLTGAGLGRGSTRRKQSASTVNPQRLADIYDPEGTVLMSATGAIRERGKKHFPPAIW